MTTAASAHLRCRWSATALLLVVALSGCVAQPDTAPSTGDNSRNALDWQGTYVGTLPCADCPGIRTRIELREDGTFTRNVAYLGSDVRLSDTGSFEWDGAGARIALTAGDGDTQRFQVGENVLFMLDRSGERITGDRAAAYRLAKIVDDSRIVNRRWNLIELDGRPVTAPRGGERVFFELDGANARVTGNASCNRFSGTYELAAGDRLWFGPDLIATRMACADLDQERRFLDVLTRVESYTLDGDALSLGGPDATPLARFRVAEE